MTIHPQFIRRRFAPALVPILFPVVISEGKIVLGKMDDLLWERATCQAIGYHGINETKHRHDTVCSKQFRWLARLNAKIAQVVS